MAAHELGYADERFEVAVSRRFHCTICLNVFKDPVMCRRNQHLFCRGCITRHLLNYHTCPVCMDELNLDTLNVAPRILTDYLAELRIRCEFFDRGCLQFIKLDDLERHVDDCGFAPAVCSNEGCQLEVNKSELIRHETAVCEWRVKCHNCAHLSREIDDVQDRLDYMEGKVCSTATTVYTILDTMTELEAFSRDMTEQMNTKLNSIDSKINRLEENGRRLQEHNQEVKATLTGLMEPLAKISRIETELKSNITINEKSDEMPNVFVAGGCCISRRSRTIEKFNMSNGSWTLESPLLSYLCRASAVLYYNQMLISGGEKMSVSGAYCDIKYSATDEIVRMNMDIPAISVTVFSMSDTKCTMFPAQLPRKLCGHCSVVYNDLMYVLGGRDEKGTISADIHEIQLVPPYSCKLVARMPVPRWNHSVQLFGDRIVCVGGEVPAIGKTNSGSNTTGSRVGSTSSVSSSNTSVSGSICNTESVLEYDITNNVCKELAPLPRSVSEAATVKFGDNIIVTGGVSSSGEPLRFCLMYNVKAQICDWLPDLSEARRGCVAAVVGNYLMVMGGQQLEHKKKGKVWKFAVSSVERFCLERYSWQQIRSMNESRYLATAIVY